MTVQLKTVLKSFFNTGDIPTEAQFADFIDSLSPFTVQFVIAANNAPTKIKAQADYVCDGINDEVQIQAAIDALPATGGKILLSEGTFTVHTVSLLNTDGVNAYYCIKIVETNPAVVIEGMPGATIIKVAAAQPNLPAIILIHGQAAAIRTSPTYLIGIEFDGNNLTDANVRFMYSRPFMVDHCTFKNGFWAGLHAYHASQRGIITNNFFQGAGSLILENNFFTVANNVFYDPVATIGTYVAALLPDYDTPIPGGGGTRYTHFGSTLVGNLFVGGSFQLYMVAINSCTIQGNVFCEQSDGGGYCMVLRSENVLTGFNADNNIVIGNTFYNCWNAILTGGVAATGASNNLFALNNIRSGPDQALQRGIYEDGGITANNKIIFNNIDAAGVFTISSTGAGTIIEGNRGYITENHGAAAAVIDGGTIAHGLVATPTWVSLAASVSGEIVTATLLGAANITVAIKKHDGTPGTAQTIYWEAKV